MIKRLRALDKGTIPRMNRLQMPHLNNFLALKTSLHQTKLAVKNTLVLDAHQLIDQNAEDRQCHSEARSPRQMSLWVALHALRSQDPRIPESTGFVLQPGPKSTGSSKTSSAIQDAAVLEFPMGLCKPSPGILQFPRLDPTGGEIAREDNGRSSSDLLHHIVVTFEPPPKKKVFFCHASMPVPSLVLFIILLMTQ